MAFYCRTGIDEMVEVVGHHGSHSLKSDAKGRFISLLLEGCCSASQIFFHLSNSLCRLV